MDKFAKKLAKILKENEEVSVYGMRRKQDATEPAAENTCR